jgi:serine/threonine-protein kinase
MGVVYRAEDLALRRTVAVKLLSPQLLDDPMARARFQREISSAVAIEHPHVVPVYSAGYDDGFFYLVLRFVSGPDLSQIVETEGPLPEWRALRLVGQVASALHAVHERGIVHRDVKPQNILVWNAGETDEHVFLTDFGIAKAIDETRSITKFGMIGTPGYMAPELREGQPASPACDQYSLGCLAFEVMTGRLPFQGGNDERETESPVNVVESLASIAPSMSSRVRETIARALSPKPQDRFADVRAFVMADETAHSAFQRSRAITDSVAHVESPAELVGELHTAFGLSEEAIAEIADLRKSQVTRLRRKAARKIVVGEHSLGPGPARNGPK